ncbi:2,5-diketo-D-gluconate reductase A [Brooklawnia cerclae]|uniref:2,5-diketo-D-gluconate reductase A n=1 Tax=Brooklawnia cerclae TaxID=349934 RepID=A0ABX0SGY9_9ACTN|nr:2,5-diketo-D-gluconate reductase A [Brooklawnia cerclae]
MTMPQLGLGVFLASEDDAEASVRYALAEAGYRHIDTASLYANEAGVGRAIAASGVPREDIFLTTKLWNSDQGYDSTLAAFDESLKKLGTDYVDLYLIHWPMPKVGKLLDTWRAFETIYSQGRAKAIGVCNHNPNHLQLILDAGTVVPAVNQIELNPNLPQYATRAFDAYHGIVTEAWSPLGGTPGGKNRAGVVRVNRLLGDPVVAAIAEKHGKSPAQVLIRWSLQNGIVVIPKSVHEARVAANIDVFDFELDGTDIEQLATLDNGNRVGPDPEQLND